MPETTTIPHRWRDPLRTGLVPAKGSHQPGLPPAGPATGPAVPADGPMDVRVSTDVETRLLQSASFFRRNPGYAATGLIGSRLLQAAEATPVLGPLVRLARPTQLGYGQPTYDQMRWQVDSGRQPNSAWWMAMNARLVGDALTAEALLREGRGGEIREPRHRAWATYIAASDEVRRALGVPVGAEYTTPGAIVDFTVAPPGNAISDAWKGASILSRLKVRYLLLPRARLAFWHAHETSIRTARRDLVELLRTTARSMPREAEFGSAWAKVIELPKHLNLMAVGHIDAKLIGAMLPQSQVSDGARLTGPQRWFTRLIQAIDRTWEQDMRPDPPVRRGARRARRP